MNWALLTNSLAVSGGATLLAVLMGFIAALWLVTLRPVWRSRLLLLSIIAMVLPPFLVTNCWLHFLGLTGVWRSWLPLNIYSLGGTIWILALLTWPIALVAVLSAWSRLEPTQLESEPMLGGQALIRWLLWPMARVSLGQAAVLTFVLALNNFAVPAILQVKVFPAEIWIKFSANLDWRAALVLSWPLILAPILLLLLLQRAEIKWPRQSNGVAAKIIRRQLGPGWFWGCGVIAIAVLLMSVALPLMQIVAVKRTWTELPTVFGAVPGVVWNSFAFSALTATACIIIALAARTIARQGQFSSFNSFNLFNRFNLFNLVPFSLALWLPFLIPGVLLGIALIWVFNRAVFEAIYHGAAIVLIAWTIRYLALSWNGVGFALQSVDPDLTDAARLDGASRWAMLRYVQWPQIAPQVGASWYITYLLCLWDVETLVLIYPPGGETLALRIFNLLHYGHNAQVNALCLLLLAIAVAPLLAWFGVRRFAGALVK